MNTETKQDRLNDALHTRAQYNYLSGACYEHDIDKLNMQFDLEWESYHGYHPIEAADWEKGFNMRVKG